MTVTEILETYDEVKIGQQIVEGAVFFTLFGKPFLLLAPSENDPTSNAAIYLYNDELSDYPHVMLRETSFADIKGFPAGEYRWVCLYEHESIVQTLVSYEDKIYDCIDRLIELLSMGPVDKEKEFQKEFMYYWNSESAGSNRFSVYLDNEYQFAEMDVFYGAKEVRLIERGLILSDIDDRDKNERKWTHHTENDVYYIPIVDNRGILPPHRGFQWTANEIQNVVYGKQIEHISSESFQQLKSLMPRMQDIILVFGMTTEQSNVTFAIKVKCRNNTRRSILDKLLYDVIAAEPLFTERKDYRYLCEQIGSSTELLSKRILLVGAGSLGSYVALELVKNGATNIRIYDCDELEDENILRWAYGGIGKKSKKAITTQLLLNLLHPQISVEAVTKNINVESLVDELADIDMVIFTIGNSDEQLKFNAALKKTGCSIPVLYAWLEEGGVFSHILFVNYQDKGCFECLYTDFHGNYVNNRARKNDELTIEKGIIRNGCGGTRAAYGTAVLLRTTAALLDTIRSVNDHTIKKSTLIDIAPDRISISDTKFPVEVCNCCGNKVK